MYIPTCLCVLTGLHGGGRGQQLCDVSGRLLRRVVHLRRSRLPVARLALPHCQAARRSATKRVVRLATLRTNTAVTSRALLLRVG